MLFVTVLLVVSTLASEVSVAGFTVSVFMVESELLFTDDEESTLTESAALPDLLLLQANTDSDTVTTKSALLNAFFMILLFLVLMLNSF